MKLIYVNTRKIEKEEPPITVDDPESTIAPDDYAFVKIGDKTVIKWNKEGHERGPKVYIETTDVVEAFNEVVEQAPLPSPPPAPTRGRKPR